jgi:hypothetical protein
MNINKTLFLGLVFGIAISAFSEKNENPKHNPENKIKPQGSSIQSATFVTGVGPNLNSALSALLPLSKTSLKDLKYCSGVVNDARIKDPKVVDYFTDLVDAFRDKTARNFIQWNCRVPAEIERAPKGSFNCDLMFNSRDPKGESPFSYGFRFYYRDGKLPGKESIECIGAG